ncbi:hypothetical protein [Cupriavidus sp. WS]|uniref:hypothetical protein n=1 Tax=Cupriavidus sp. WS TaxID=1312922 RepID=UPI0003641791|nr:hypothetical protein [Cupriavidus sp. WS]
MLVRHLAALAGAALLAAGAAGAATEAPPGSSLACARADNMYCRVPPRPGARPAGDMKAA